MTTGEKIALARKRNGLTQQELAQLLGVSLQAVSQHERGVRNPTIKVLKRYAEALNVSLADLIDLSERDKPSGDCFVMYAESVDEVVLLRWFRSSSQTKRSLFVRYISEE